MEYDILEICFSVREEVITSEDNSRTEEVFLVAHILYEYAGEVRELCADLQSLAKKEVSQEGLTTSVTLTHPKYKTTEELEEAVKSIIEPSIKSYSLNSQFNTFVTNSLREVQTSLSVDRRKTEPSCPF